MPRSVFILMVAVAFPWVVSADTVVNLNPAEDASGIPYGVELVHVRFSDIFGPVLSSPTAPATWGEGVGVLSLADVMAGDPKELPLDLPLEILSAHAAAASWVLPPRELDTLTFPGHNAHTHIRHTAWGQHRLFRW